MEDVIGIAITALVGIAGIASTHLLARSQRAAEDKRLRTERKERYRFARHETVAKLSGEFVGELRGLESNASIRARVNASIAREIRAIPDKAKADAENASDPKVAEELRALAERFDADPDMVDEHVNRSIKEPQHFQGIPSLPDTAAILTNLSDLSAQLQIQGGTQIGEAAKRAHSAASATLFKLESLELDGYKESLDIKRLTRAIEEFINAAIFELRIDPHDKDANFEDIIKQAKRETSKHSGQDRAEND